MDNVEILPKGSIGINFIPREYLTAGKDEYYLRNQQIKGPKERWRRLRPEEIERLLKNNNRADNWETVLVSNDFNPDLIRDSEFFGLVRIGALRDATLQHHDLRMPAGITKSRIISCDIGDDTAIHDVRYLAHYIIGDRCLLTAIGELYTTNQAKFGNGILKDGEAEESRIWMEIMNECGGRKVLPFDGMIPADAYLWAKYRDDAALQKKLKEITQKKFDPRRGFYGEIGDQCVIKNTGILKDVQIGDHCSIKGANKIKNITINSTADEQTQIGEGVELVNGIIGRGCHIFYGCKAVRFILGDNSNLKYGALLLDSFLGESSTLSSCEVRNSLVYPAHEQHHSTSFLIASVVMGQSNVAAGAIIGSNHNSRSNDNEIQAGRGFWPGLCTSIKHSSRFASFVLPVKGDYPAEMDIPLPFSLLSNNDPENRLEVIPAYWWLYNMYALARNYWKYRDRDQRKNKIQNIEFDPLAPDTAEEIFNARRLLEIWTAKAAHAGPRKKGQRPALKEEKLARIGRELLTKNKKRVQALEILGEGMEKSKRKTVIIKAAEGYEAYGDMLHYYAVKNCLDYMQENVNQDFAALCEALKGKRDREWTDCGGQIIPAQEVDRLRADIGSGALDTWDSIHGRYNRLWEAYILAKQRHAFATLCDLLGISGTPTRQQWLGALDRGVKIQEYICDQAYLSRKKDDNNPFRRATFRNATEMRATVGMADEDIFVKRVRKETEAFKMAVKEVKNRG